MNMISSVSSYFIKRFYFLTDSILPLSILLPLSTKKSLELVSIFLVIILIKSNWAAANSYLVLGFSSFYSCLAFRPSMTPCSAAFWFSFFLFSSSIFSAFYWSMIYPCLDLKSVSMIILFLRSFNSSTTSKSSSSPLLLQALEKASGNTSISSSI